MKKLRLFGMFALTFALVFGAASCKQDAGPSGDNVADVLADGEDLSGTWKVVSGSLYMKMDTMGQKVEIDTDNISEVIEENPYIHDASIELDTKEKAKAYFEPIAKSVEEMNNAEEMLKEAQEELGSNADVDYNMDARFVINGDRNKITYYAAGDYSVTASYKGQTATMSEEIELEVVFEKQ